MQVVYVPLGFVRDVTIPMSEEESWSKARAMTVPITYCFAFMFLFNMFEDLFNFGCAEDDDECMENHEAAWFNFFISLALAAAGVPFSLLIFCKTTSTRVGDGVLLPFSILAFIQSIAWINFASNCVVDLLKLFGFIT